MPALQKTTRAFENYTGWDDVPMEPIPRTLGQDYPPTQAWRA